MCKIFIDIEPTIRVVGGLVHIQRTGGEYEVWPMGVFTSFMGTGMRAVRDFQSGVAPVVRMPRKRRVGS